MHLIVQFFKISARACALCILCSVDYLFALSFASILEFLTFMMACLIVLFNFHIAFQFLRIDLSPLPSLFGFLPL